jgi:hypothetical protein
MSIMNECLFMNGNGYCNLFVKYYLDREENPRGLAA